LISLGIGVAGVAGLANPGGSDLIVMRAGKVVRVPPKQQL
jgi:hypothetical protein